jgi:hypothetical protein
VAERRMPGGRRPALVGIVAVGMLCWWFGSGVAWAGQATDQPGTPPPAASTPDGYAVQTAVRFSGDAAPAGSRRVRVTPTCWWAPASGHYTDAAAMLTWYDAQTQGSQNRGIVMDYGPRSIWVDAVKAEAAGEDLSWYVATCVDPANYGTFVGGCEEYIEPGHGPQTWVCYRYKAFPAGGGVPGPLVTPADLAAAARDVMVIPVPTFDRNPKVVKAGQATLVGLATWFWVTDPAATGGATGTRTIRAQIGPAWAQVVATTTGLRLSSPAGSASCTPGQARTAWRQGTLETSACTLAFTKASVRYPAGYPVTATTRWTADWTGSGATSGALDPLTRTWVGNVPVAEVQTIVTG